jgi:transposase
MQAITAVLGLDQVVVLGVGDQGHPWVVTVECPPPVQCPHGAGTRWHRHGRGRPRVVAHAWVGLRPVHLVWTPERWRCAGCGRTTPPRPAGLRLWQRWTPLAQATALQALQRDSFAGVARVRGVGPGRLRRLVDRVVPLEDPTWQTLAGDVVLSIDEHSFRGPALLISGAVQPLARRVVTFLPDDRIRSLAAWLAQLPESVRARIRGTTTDLKRAYGQTVRRQCPAVQVLADPFHVIEDANHRLDEGRRLEQAESGQGIPRWPLRKAAERLTPRQQAQRDALLLRYPTLAALYRLKEDLRAVFRCRTAAEAAPALSRWRVNAEACDHAEGRV